MGPSVRPLNHKVAPSMSWTRNEQSLLKHLLAENYVHQNDRYCPLCRYASDSKLCYAKIPGRLKHKTFRDVALHRIWITKQKNGKRKKGYNNSSRKRIPKKEKVSGQQAKPTSHATNCVKCPASMNSNDGISYEAIGDVTELLLEQNAQALDRITANFSALKASYGRVSPLRQVHENISLFCQTRNNIATILNELTICDMPEEMKRMPPLPMKLNEELLNSMLPRTIMAPGFLEYDLEADRMMIRKMWLLHHDANTF